jgi:hypothetical protein
MRLAGYNIIYNALITYLNNYKRRRLNEVSMVYLVWAAVGVSVYAVAHFFLKPILTFRATRGAIAHALAEFSDVDTAGDVRISQARGTYREQASTLRAQVNSIPYYTVWSSLKILPTFAEIDKASANLIGLSNIIGLQLEKHDKNTLRRNIEIALHLK